MSEAKGVVSIVDVSLYAELGVPWAAQDTRALVQPVATPEATGVRRSVSEIDLDLARLNGGWPDTHQLVGTTPNYDNEPHGLPYDHPEHNALTARSIGLIVAGVALLTCVVGNAIGAFSSDKPSHPVKQPGIEVPTNQNRPDGFQLP